MERDYFICKNKTGNAPMLGTLALTQEGAQKKLIDMFNYPQWLNARMAGFECVRVRIVESETDEQGTDDIPTAVPV